MRPSLRSLRRRLEIALLELVDAVLRHRPRVRLPHMRLPRLRLSRVRLSRVRLHPLPLSRVRLPHVPLPRVPAVWLQRLPRVPMPHHLRKRWVAAGAAAALLPGLVAGVVLMQGASAHPGATRPAVAAPYGPFAVEPSPQTPVFDPSLFRAAAKRAPAAPALLRLPQVNLNGLSIAGIPRAALAAYVTATRMTNKQDTSCHLHWWLLAGIGLVESGHAHDGGSTQPKWNGIAKPPIFGPRLDGKHGFAAIRDTDHGVLDQDKKWDRAVGPMQFLPSTWASWGGTTRGKMRDPQDIRAATLAAAGYLCASGADLSQAEGLAAAVYSYNHSFDYVRLVLTVAARYAGIDPNALGVNRLPHDKPKKKAAKKKASSSTGSSPAATTSPTSGSSPSPTSSSGGGSSPSPAPSPSGVPSLPPVPTPTVGF